MKKRESKWLMFLTDVNDKSGMVQNGIAISLNSNILTNEFHFRSIGRNSNFDKDNTIDRWKDWMKGCKPMISRHVSLWNIRCHTTKARVYLPAAGILQTEYSIEWLIVMMSFMMCCICSTVQGNIVLVCTGSQTTQIAKEKR